MTNKGKILIIEDLSQWQEELKFILEKEGFQVDTAASLQEAITKLASSFYHLATIDIRLSDWDENSEEGITVLDELQRLDLGEAVEKIMLSAYGSEERVRTAFKHHNIFDFIPKREFDRTEFIAVIQEVFRMRVRTNFGLEILLEDGLSYEELGAGIVLQGEQLKNTSELLPRVVEEVEDLLRKLFVNANKIILRCIATEKSAIGRITVDPFYTEDPNESVLVRLGDQREIAAEYNHYQEHAYGSVGGNQTGGIMNKRRTALLGGIVYALVRT